MDIDIDTEMELTREEAEELENVNEVCWFRKGGINSKYYTPFTAKKTEYFPINKPTTSGEPTSEEMATSLNSGFHYDSIKKVFYKSTRKTPSVKARKLPAGAYLYKNYMGLEVLVPMSIRKDDTIVSIKNGVERAQEMVDNFISKEALYRKHGLTYRMGILAYGPPGTGKSLSLRKLINTVTSKNDGIAIYIDQWIPSIQFLEVVKNSCKGRIKVFVFEEFTEFLANPYQKRDAVLNFLDGELSADKSITIATTNHPEKIPGNIKNRPGRFDQQILFKNPDRADRKKMFEHFLSVTPSDEELDNSVGLSVSALKECCVDVLIRNKKLLTSINELQERIKASKEFNKKKETPVPNTLLKGRTLEEAIKVAVKDS